MIILINCDQQHTNKDKPVNPHFDLFSFIKNIDMFGVPILLFHKQKDSYRSVIGGCVSLILIVCIMTYTGWRFEELFERSGDVIKIGSLYYVSKEEQLIYPKKDDLRF